MIEIDRSRWVVGAAIAVTVAAAAALLVSRSPVAFAQATDNRRAPTTYLEKMAASGTATFHARELVMYMGSHPSNAVLDVRSSPKGRYVRAEVGSAITRLWQRVGRDIVASSTGAMEDDAPPLVAIKAADVLSKYDVTVGASEKILGVDLVPLTFERRSDRSTAERLWVQAYSGIVYRREVYGVRGELVGLSTIIDMSWGENATAERFDSAAQPPSKVLAAAATTAPRSLPIGYTLAGASSFRTDGRRITHWVYSDGLHALSVFRTAGGLRAPKGFEPILARGARLWAGPGPGTWAWEGGGASWVVVAEEPGLDPGALTAVFPHGRPSAWARMGSLWSHGFRMLGRLIP